MKQTMSNFPYKAKLNYLAGNHW